MITPERKTLESQIADAESAVARAQRRYDAKKAELARAIISDNEDLFGERKSATAHCIFTVRVDPSRSVEILKPFQREVDTATENLRKLRAKRECPIPETLTLFT